MARPGLLRDDVRLRSALVALLLTGCSAGASPHATCVEHAVEEGVDRQAAQAACDEAVGEPGG